MLWGRRLITLLCTVRNCRQPLVRDDRRLVCTRAHSFDIARSGYCNLLQPQDSRSRNPGDSANAVAARRRFLDAGYGETFLKAMVELVPATPAATLDAGCGEGYHLDGFRRAYKCEAHGIDISTPAIDAAARRYPDCHFIVGNADRFLPYADGSFGLVTSITARVNSGEFRRVIAGDGHLMIVLPGPDDLIELREAVLGERRHIDRVDKTVESLRENFELIDRRRVAMQRTLDHSAIEDVMHSSYRGLRKRESELMMTIGRMDVTFSRDLLLFRPS
jgi:23S rRNA (guanine745-N1)-methyltransferase